MLEHNVRFRKCKRCGKYFIMKGNYDTNYCDRIAEGETRNCQDLAAQENYKKKMADNAAIPLYQKVLQALCRPCSCKDRLKSPISKKWKYQAMTKRDECSNGKITLAEFEAWLEGSFPNRKKKKNSHFFVNKQPFFPSGTGTKSSSAFIIFSQLSFINPQ